MLTRLLKRLDEQEAEGAHEREKAALERDAATRVHNQLLRLRCSEEPGRGIQMSPVLNPHNHVRRIPLALKAAEGITDLHPHAAWNATSPQRLLTSRI